MSKSVCRFALTPGEPAGIGPDLVVELAMRSRLQDWIVIADQDLLARAARRLGHDVIIDDNIANPSRDAGRLTVHHIDLAEPEQPGTLNANNARYVLQTLEAAGA